MKKFLLTLALLISAPSFAASCQQQIGNISGISDTTKQEMIVKCEQTKLDLVKQADVVLTEATVDKVDRWSEISLRFAKAIGVAAEEMGMAANNFLKTDAGKLTAALIVWHVMGDDLSAIISGALIITLGFLLGYFFYKIFTYNGKEEVQSRIWGTKKVNVYKTWRDLDEAPQWCIVIYWIAYLIVTMVVLV